MRVPNNNLILLRRVLRWHHDADFWARPAVRWR
jgi:hypothetical protein